MNLLFQNKTYDSVLYAEREMKSNLATGDPVICKTPFHYSWSKKSEKGRPQVSESPFHIETQTT